MDAAIRTLILIVALHITGAFKAANSSFLSVAKMKCSATIKMRVRIAASKNVPDWGSVASSDMFL